MRSDPGLATSLMLREYVSGARVHRRHDKPHGSIRINHNLIFVHIYHFASFFELLRWKPRFVSVKACFLAPTPLFDGEGREGGLDVAETE